MTVTGSSPHRPHLVYRNPTAQLEEVIRDLSARDHNTVLRETKEFLEARADGARSYLEMGRHLEVVQQILEPTGKFLDYIKSIPHLSQATAYRHIWAWQNAQRVLPPATLEAAATIGVRLISWQKDGDFTPQFKRAITKVEREMGSPPAKDVNKAAAWIQRAMEVKREMAPKTRVFNSDNVTIRILRAFQRFLERVPPEDRGEAARTFIGQLVKLAGVPVSQVKPHPLPAHFSMPRRGRPVGGEREDIA